MGFKQPILSAHIKVYYLIWVLIIAFLSSCSKNSTPAIVHPANTLDTSNSSNNRQSVNTPSGIVYKYANAISLSGVSNQTISGDSINCDNAYLNGISLYNCHNIHITKCKIYNSSADGIFLINCSNITIDTCYITNVTAGVNATYSTGVTVNYNQMKNMRGPVPTGQFVQFNNVNGTGNSVTNNNLENIYGAGNPEDAISMYKSNGTAASPILISGNWIRGGGPSKTGGGINLGDDGGSYLTAENNILVNPGQYGITISAGTNMQILNNEIYAAQNTFTNVGIEVWNQYTSISGCSVITINGNKVNWTNANGIANSNWSGNNCGTLTDWSTGNYWGDAAITSSILPAVIITYQ